MIFLFDLYKRIYKIPTIIPLPHKNPSGYANSITKLKNNRSCLTFRRLFFHFTSPRPPCAQTQTNPNPPSLVRSLYKCRIIIPQSLSPRLVFSPTVYEPRVHCVEEAQNLQLASLFFLRLSFVCSTTKMQSVLERQTRSLLYFCFSGEPRLCGIHRIDRSILIL